MTTPAPFIPVNELERLLMAAASGGPAERKAFEAALLTEPLYAATTDKDDTGDVVTLLSVEHRGALRATALFTAPERAAGVFGPKVRTVSWPSCQMATLPGGSRLTPLKNVRSSETQRKIRYSCTADDVVAAGASSPAKTALISLAKTSVPSRTA